MRVLYGMAPNEADSQSDRIFVGELPFVPMISETEIRDRVRDLGQALHNKLAGSEPVFLVMLKGAFVFAADLVRASGLAAEISFVRTKSYHGTERSGKIDVLLAPEEELVRDRPVVLVEDIVDSGYTMQAFLPLLTEMGPKSVTLVTLLHKPTAAKVKIDIDLVGFTIPKQFVVGYGLDYNGRGRQLPAIYQLAQDY